MIKAVLFDMDGVLIEAKDWHFESLNRALALFGMPISRFDHLTSFDGLPTAKKLEYLSLERGLPVQLHKFINQMKQRYLMDIVQTECKPLFVHQQLLSKLRSKGIKVAVCSNSIRSSVETMMQKAEIFEYLDFIVSNEDVTHAKPSPEMYQKAMSHFGLNPQECLIVEDNENGIRAAIASGGHLLVVDRVEDVNVDNVFARIGELEVT